MKMRSGIKGSGIRTGVVVALFCAYFFAPSGLAAQSGQVSPPVKPDALPDIVPNHLPATVPNAAATSSTKEKRTPPRTLGDRLPEKPSIAPTFMIPVGPLGFTAPGLRYLGMRNSLVSLDFLDNDHLLFTFRVPGLIRRETARQDGENERQIRALVIEVKTGRVEAEALWTVHDLVRYLWMLKDGHFLLRDRDGLEVGDSSLVLKPLLQFPGQVEWLEMDPEQQYMVTNSTEPASAAARPGQVDSPSTAAVSMEADNQNTPLRCL